MSWNLASPFKCHWHEIIEPKCNGIFCFPKCTVDMDGHEKQITYLYIAIVCKELDLTSYLLLGFIVKFMATHFKLCEHTTIEQFQFDIVATLWVSNQTLCTQILSEYFYES